MSRHRTSRSSGLFAALAKPEMLHAEVTACKSTPPRGTEAPKKRCLLLGMEGQFFLSGVEAAAALNTADQCTPSMVLPSLLAQREID